MRFGCSVTQAQQNHGVMSTDKTIKFSPAKSILKVQIGDEIKLTESDFIVYFIIQSLLY
jgi:hypothetical protein